MVFLPGNHALDRKITVSNVVRLTMWGESSSDNIVTVVRNGSVGLSFTNMVDFNIYSLAFTSHNRSWSYSSQPASKSALLLQSTRNAKLVNCFFHDNLGNGLTVHNTNITLEGNKFTHNQCGCELFSDDCKLGCGITALNSNLTFIGNTSFHENNASYYESTGAIWASASSLDFNGMNSFIDNSAEYGSGGAIHAETSTSLTFNGTSTFSNNSAEWYGGAIYAETYSSLRFSGTSTFSSNTAGYDGGVINVYDTAVLIFNGTSNFINNSANGDGGAVNAYDGSVLTLTGSSSFSSNSAKQGGAITVYYNSTLLFDGRISFVNNTGDSHGGALYLYISSAFSILPHTTVHWENNHANLGGAIFVYDANPRIYCNRYVSMEECFFQLPGHNLSHGIKSIEMQLFFKNNSADSAGSVLYGGAVDNCKVNGLESNSSGEVFDMLAQYEADNTTSSISSDPFHICPCENNSPNCSKSIKTLSVYPGETYQVSVVTVGQRNGTVPANVTSMDRYILPCSQIVQPTNRACTTLSYTVDPKQKVSLELYTESTCSALVLKLNGTQSCTGSANNSLSCICDQAHRKYGIDHCSLTNGSVEITHESEDTFWVGYNLSYRPGLIVHPYCPFDYCVNHRVSITLNNTDSQCAHNRRGILCGSCKQGYSLELGTFQCTKCTNHYVALLVPLALIGIALVFLLLVCKLTVATGTISGLVFYANIVGEIHTIFLPVKSTDVLSVFIAWLNLDFGIETCFYDGMDAYSKAWLQFVFPIYLWVLVGLMIIISHLSPKFADVLGSNPVSALATLILLSYAKILRTLITAVSFTYLEYPNIVWLYDANIEYLSNERIPLLLVTLLVFFLFLPYTLLLLFGQWLQAISHLRLFSWVNRLKPFMDSYHTHTNQNIATGLDYCLYFALFFFLCLLSILSKTPVLTSLQFY